MRFKSKIVILCILVTLLLLNGCKNTEDIKMVVDGYTVIGDLDLDQMQPPKIGEEILVVQTNKGTIKIRLFDKIAPKTVAAIKELVSQGFYNRLKFSNIIKDLGFQVEVPVDKTEAIEVMGPDYIEEYHDEYRNFTGAVGLARYNGIGSFYFITNSGIEKEYLKSMKQLGDLYPKEIIDAYAILGGHPNFDKEFTVFGQVFYGLDTVMEISNLPFQEDESMLQTENSIHAADEVIIEKIELDIFEGK